jgi:uncharacterized circularly permuted ATP-grasp superfamily protein
MRSALPKLALIGVLALTACWSPASRAPASLGEPKYYDEVFDEEGHVRPHYQKVYFAYQSMSKAERKRFLRETKKVDFRGDNMLDPLPRVLMEGEADILRRGVEMRATALRMFLQDYHSGNDRIYQIIPKDVLEQIVERSGESGFRGLVKPSTIAFPYGPDIIRDASGRWRVIEDNPGFIGGPGDLKQARESIFKRWPKYRDAIRPKDDPMDFYREIVKRAKKRATPKGGKVVVYQVPPYPDAEDTRLRKIYQDLGVEVVTPNTKRKLVATQEGVFLQEGKKREAVGYLVLNGEHKWIDAKFPVTREQYLHFEAQSHLDSEDLSKEARKQIGEALEPNSVTRKVDYHRVEKALEKSNLPNGYPVVLRNSPSGLMEAILEGKVATNYSPGVDFIGDKLFYTYVDDLVRFYLKKDPIVSNIPSIHLSKRGAFEKAFDKGAYKKFVFKPVGGRGGDGIYIGTKIADSDVAKVRAHLLSHRDDYIAQEFTPLSRAEDRILDMRLITDVAPDSAFVSRTPWGRGVPISGDGKVNLSKHGREFAVMVTANPRQKSDCVQMRLYESLMSQ